MSKLKPKTRGKNVTSVCPDCRVTVRNAFGRGICPKCQRPTLSIGDKYRVPVKGDTKGWRLLIKRMGMVEERGLPNVPLRMFIGEGGSYDEVKRSVFQVMAVHLPFRPIQSISVMVRAAGRYPNFVSRGTCSY